MYCALNYSPIFRRISIGVSSASDRDLGLWRGTRPRMNERMDERTNGDNSVLWDAARCSRETRAEWSRFLQTKGTSRSHRHLGEGKPPPVPAGTKRCRRLQPAARNNHADVHGSPTVNGDHFKRSRPQCVYLANVKFTRGEKGSSNRYAARRHLAALSLEKTEIRSFCIAEDSPRSHGAWLVVTPL